MQRTIYLLALWGGLWLGAAADAAPELRLSPIITVGVIGVGEGGEADLFGSVEGRTVAHWHGLRGWVGLTAVDGDNWFAGGGFVFEFEPSPAWHLAIGTGPFYFESTQRDLGFDLEFYSFFEATYRMRQGTRLGLRVGHLSNAGLGRINPGVETVALVAIFPLGRR